MTPSVHLAVKVDAAHQTLAFVNATMRCALIRENKTTFVAVINVAVTVVANVLEKKNRALSGTGFVAMGCRVMTASVLTSALMTKYPKF